MLPDKKIKCHRTGFKMTCHEGVAKHHCQLWMLVQGTHPQTGQEVNRYGCADNFLPLIMLENTQMQRQTGAAVESLRNNLIERIDQRALPHIGRLS